MAEILWPYEIDQGLSPLSAKVYYNEVAPIGRALFKTSGDACLLDRGGRVSHDFAGHSDMGAHEGTRSPSGIAPRLRTMSDSRIYSRQLLSKGNGIPIFLPQPFESSPAEYRMHGTQVGDVCHIAFDGSVSVLFNVCREADDALNVMGVPAGFERLALNEPAELARRDEWVKPGSDICSAAIKKRRVDFQAGVDGNIFVPPCAGASIDIELSNTSRQIGLLVLPDGASRTDALPLKRFRKYAIKHARSWYTFASETLERDIDEDDLYLVTGFDKCTSWSVAALDNQHRVTGLSLRCTAAQVGTVGGAYSWGWETISSFANSGPSARRAGEETWRDNQTVFIRGFKVAVRSGVLGRKTGRAVSMLNLKKTDIDAMGGPRGPGLVRRLTDPASLRGLFGGGSGRMRDDDKPYHPSDMINACILESNPDVDVSVIHDTQWISVLESDQEFPTDRELFDRIRAKYVAEIYLDGASLIANGADFFTDEPESTVEQKRCNSRLPEIVDPQLRLQVFDELDSIETGSFEVKFALPHETLIGLGASALELIAISLVTQNFPRLMGKPAKAIAEQIVNDASLSEIAVECEIFGISSERSSDVLRAYIGALFHEDGFSSVKNWFETLLQPYCLSAYQKLREEHSSGPSTPQKATAQQTPRTSLSGAEISQLHELMQSHQLFGDWQYKYGICRNGLPGWLVDVQVGRASGHGEGANKKIAKNEAAQDVLCKLQGLRFSSLVSPALGMESTEHSISSVDSEALRKAKKTFLRLLEDANTAKGPVKKAGLKTRSLNASEESALNDFVASFGCSMEARYLTRAEQNRVDRRRKACSYHTWFTITPEAQERFKVYSTQPTSSPAQDPSPARMIKTVVVSTSVRSTSVESTSLKQEDKACTPPSFIRSASPRCLQSSTVAEDEAQSMSVLSAKGPKVTMDLPKFDSLFDRITSAVFLLPSSTEVGAGKREQMQVAREILMEVAQEMRVARPLKRKFGQQELE
ncbi:unnamed protein product [Mycena citricolor]|uniref:DRBM domain-containing protein n=1 Tax=Mycena citricolor TaxID=2018698 RepID=A0AAD2HMG2_9AGAR|nr:unnamed protein product [Mycena citricolor]